MTRTYVRRPVKESASSLLTGHRLYRLDVELGRLEFLVHPAMGQEDLLVRRAGAVQRVQRALPVTAFPAAQHNRYSCRQAALGLGQVL